MHHRAAVRRLRMIADKCQEIGRWRGDPPLRAAYAFGAVVDSRDDLDWVRVAFVLDLPVEELTWFTRPRWSWSMADVLDVDKAPVDWYLRPAAWPVSNHVIRRPLRIWSTGGVEEAALAALSRGEAEALRMPAPSPGEQAKQLAIELAASLAHLRRVRDGFYERDWRAEHKGIGRYPEDHLWDAVHGYLDLLDAVESAGGG